MKVFKHILNSALMLSLAGSIYANTSSHVNTSPFTETILIKTKNFKNDIMLQYRNDNGINITGPKDISPSMEPVPPVVISSNNKFENGYPAIIINNSCAINMIDGPWSRLDYSPSKPICKNISLSDITPDSQYQYTLTLSYHA